MTGIAEIAGQSSVILKSHAVKLLSGIKAVDFAKKPSADGKLIDTNHPAFIFGHLSLYPFRISKLLDLGLSEFEPSKQFFNLFSIGAKCEHDPDLKIYPPMNEITEFYFNGQDKINSLLKDIPDSKLIVANNDERSKERFPILGGFIVYLLTAHHSGHLGQLSVWRRCMGLGSAV